MENRFPDRATRRLGTKPPGHENYRNHLVIP